MTCRENSQLPTAGVAPSLKLVGPTLLTVFPIGSQEFHLEPETGGHFPIPVPPGCISGDINRAIGVASQGFGHTHQHKAGYAVRQCEPHDQLKLIIRSRAHATRTTAVEGS
jgi:hypothetical protein